MTEYRKSLIEKLFAIDEGFGAFKFDFDGDSLKLKHPLEEAMAVIECDAELMEEKDEKIKQLEAKIVEFEAQVPRWIPVKEKLPDIDPDAVYSDCTYSQELFVFDGKQLAAAYYCHTTKQWHDSRCEDDILDVKYWAQPIPLPEAPKEEHE